MEDKTYILSGHHLNNLISYYRHFDDFESFRYDMSKEWLYDEQTVERIVDSHKRLVDNPNTRIQIVEGEDDICKLCCNKTKCYDMQTEEVIEQHKRKDRDFLENYGLKTDSVLTMRDITLNFVFWKIAVSEPAN